VLGFPVVMYVNSIYNINRFVLQGSGKIVEDV